MEPTEERRHGSVVWKCQCVCGNYHFTTVELLLSGKCQSCGCLKSKGNQKIKSLLQSNNYIFIPEYPVRINDKTYYFDFALFDKNNKILCFIEYDGILHFEQDNYHGWNTKENWEKTKTNDNIKNNYGKENNIEIIRIPYLDYDKITIDYI